MKNTTGFFHYSRRWKQVFFNGFTFVFRGQKQEVNVVQHLMFNKCVSAGFKPLNVGKEALCVSVGGINGLEGQTGPRAGICLPTRRSNYRVHLKEDSDRPDKILRAPCLTSTAMGIISNGTLKSHYRYFI